MLRKTIRILGLLLILILLVMICLLSVIQLPGVQTYITRQYIMPGINNAFGAKVKVDHVDITFFGNLRLKGITAYDNRDNLLISIEQLRAKPDYLSLISGPPYRFDKLSIIKPKVFVRTYKGEKQDNFLAFIGQFSSTGEKTSKEDFVLQGNIQVENGYVEIINENLTNSEQVWVKASGLNLNASDFKIDGGNIYAKIKNLSFRAKRNDKIKSDLTHLAGDFTYKNDLLEIKDVKIKTSYSDIKGQFAFTYKSPQDFSDFHRKVNWKLDLDKGSYVGMKDVQYFAPFWDKASKVAISGELRGVMDKWELNNVKLSTMNTRLESKKILLGKIYSKKNFSIQSENLFAATNYKDLASFLPTSINKDLPRFISRYGKMSIDGSFFIDHNNLKTKSLVRSSLLGRVFTDLIVNDYNKETIHYFGILKPQQFDLKTFTNIQQLGNISADLNVDGYGTNFKKLDIKAIGKVLQLDLFGRQLQNIIINGRVVKKIFEGKIQIDDPNIAMNFDGKVDFSSSAYRATFESEIQQINLYGLNLSKDPNARLTSSISLDIKASSIDDLLGQISLSNTFYQNSIQSFAFGNMLINSSVDKEGKRLLNFKSDELINGYIDGNFKLSQILKVSQNAFGKLLSHYKPKDITPGQFFEFNFDIKDYFFETLFPAITLKPGTHLQGAVTADNDLILNAKTPGILYKQIELGESDVRLNTANRSFQTSIISKNAAVAGYKLDNINISSIKRNDTIDIKANFVGGFKGISKQKAALSLYKATNEKGEDVIGLLKSTIEYNNNRWVLNPNNDKNTNYAIIDLKKNKYDIRGLSLSSGNQKLSIEGSYINKKLALDLKIKNTRLESLIPFTKNLKLSGLANGDIKIKHSGSAFLPVGNLKIKQFNLNNYAIGDILMEVTPEADAYKVKGTISNNALTRLIVTGKINPNKKQYLDLKVKFNDFQTGILNQFLSGVIENIRGSVKGEINVRGSFKEPIYEGSLHLNKGGLKIVYLGTDYDILGSPEVLISNGLIYFYDIIYLEDIKHKSKTMLSGTLYHKNFLNWDLDLTVDSHVKYNGKYSNKTLILDTDFKDNPLFYGTVYAKDLYANIKGATNDLDIRVIATTAPQTHLIINTDKQNLEISKSVKFVNISKYYDNKTSKQEKQPKRKEKTKLNLSLSTKITPEARMEIILDDKNDDKIVANGKGNVRLDVDLNGNMTMNGEVQITNGYYNFSREFIKKVFKIRPNSTIKWIGDVYNAQLDVKAYFDREVSNIGDYISGYAQTLKTELEVGLTGALSSPKINFNVLTPNAPESIRNNLSIKFSDKDEEAKQWAALLLLGKFLPADDTNYIDGLTTTAYELAFSQMSSLISNISKYLTVNFSYTKGSEEYNTADRFNVKGKVDINPRVSVNVSGGVSLANHNDDKKNNDSKITNEQLVAGSVEVDYDISRQNDGSLKLKAFTRPTSFGIENFNSTNNYSQTWGAGIYYHEDFDNFKELKEKIFKRKKKRKKRKEKARLDSLEQVLKKKIPAPAKDTLKIEGN